VTYPINGGGTKTIPNVPVNPDGTFTVPTPGDAVNGELTAVAKDPAGNKSQPGTGTIDTIIPGQPQNVSGNNKEITGKVPGPIKTDETVSVTYKTASGADKTVDNVPITVNPTDGSGSFTLPTPPDAVNGTLSAVAVDSHGNQSQPGTGTLRRNAPDKPVVDPTNGTEITGKAEGGSTVDVTDDQGKPIPGCTGLVADVNTGAFQCTPTNPIQPKSDGTPAVIEVTATDDHGNTSEPATVTLDSLTVTVSKTNPNPGEVVTVTGEHFNPGEKVTVTMCSTCAVVGSGTADANGKVVVTVTIPADAPAGTHTITATGETSGAVSTSITVVEVPKAPTGGSVADTTSRTAGLLVGLMIAAGGALLVANRRLGVKR